MSHPHERGHLPGGGASFWEGAGKGRWGEKGSRDLWGPWSNQGVGSMKHGEARILGVGEKDWRQLGRSASNAAKATVVNGGTLTAPILLVLSEDHR